ncbi:hypothetical protein AAGS61_08440 [Lysinibacillus sp. KU-BSD001]|uniref:hypothetical protein n=1 Tax=Lysinibacillus sp. KU-BSD001 TaxID=3141328 RepID=UPI0036E153A3
MFKHVSKFQMVSSFVMALLGLSQAFNHWGERTFLSLFFFSGSIFLLILTIMALIDYRKRQMSKD